MVSRQTSDEFNFVGLARSPVKQTPETGYYGAGGALEGAATLNTEPSSAATTERMSSTGSSSSSSSSSGGNRSLGSHHQRRHALQPVASNVLLDVDVPVQTPSASFVSFPSSSRKPSSASSFNQRSRLPVSRTLKLSPDTTGSINAADSTVNRNARNERSQSTPSRLALFSANPSPMTSREAAARPVAFLTPRASERAAATATAARRGASPSPILISAMDSSATTATPVQQQPSTPAVLDPYLSTCSPAIDSSDDAGEWSDCSFAPGEAFSPDPATPATQTRSMCAPKMAHTIYEDRETMTESPVEMNSINSSPGWTTTYLRTGSGVTPLPPATEGQSRSAPRERSTAATNNNHNNSNNNINNSGMTPVAASFRVRMGADRSRTPGSRSDRSVGLGPPACATADVPSVGGVTPDTPTAAAVLVAMGGAAVGACGTCVQFEGEQEEGKEEEEEVLVPQECLEVPMDVQVQSIAASPGSPTPTANMRARRPAVTPRRPIAASALLELSQGTPRRMIRGIINGVPPSGTPHHRQQRFVPQVTKVMENSEEETPRGFIMGMVGNRQAGGTTAAACSAASVPAFGSSRPRSSSTADAAAAAAAAAAATAATVAAVAVAAAAAESSEDRCGNVDGESAPGVLQTVVAAASVTLAPVSEIGTTTSAHDEGRQRLDAAFGMRKVLLRTMIILSVTAFVCIALFGLLVFVCIAFAGPPLTIPIH